ncbi:MAG: alanine:cation symporter family protein [Bdellovibrionales bacterium]|nr:alanine:cation symporter family protein [Bdellovibrionales bacterium]
MLPQFLSQWIAHTVDFVWGTPLVVLLMGGGLGLFIYSSFLPLRGFFHAFQLIFGKHSTDEEKAEGQLSHFQALTNALAATVGMGNIAGVAVAITQGGPGAVFWMWIAAIVGMNTKFYECTLSVMYRGHDYRGEVQGGPMYVISQAMPKKFLPAAYFFAICGTIGCMALFNVNQLSSYLNEEYNIRPIYIGFISAVFVAFVLKGGVRRLGNVTGVLVPLMAVIYFFGSLLVILLNAGKVPELFLLIFKDAFTGQAMFGGAVGYGFLEVMKVGVKRAAFSNEAGVGTAPMAHGNAKTAEPISEGLVAMLGPFFDTIIICTMTALVILITLPIETFKQSEGVHITIAAFETTLPGFGRHILGLAVLLFSVTTMIGMANYNEKCWNFLFRGRWGLGENTFIAVFCATLIFGAISALDDVVNILDIGFGLMAYPNMITTLWLAPKVKSALKDYFKRYKI